MMRCNRNYSVTAFTWPLTAPFGLVAQLGVLHEYVPALVWLHNMLTVGNTDHYHGLVAKWLPGNYVERLERLCRLDGMARCAVCKKAARRGSLHCLGQLTRVAVCQAERWSWLLHYARP